MLELKEMKCFEYVTNNPWNYYYDGVGYIKSDFCARKLAAATSVEGMTILRLT